MPSRATFVPVSGESIKEKILEQIFDAILSGKIRPGDRLNESDLSRQLKVSRAPIRESLHQLQEQGLVLNHPRRGMFVVHLDPSDVRKITRVRLLLEAEALLECRESLNAAGRRKLLRLLDRLENAGDVSRGSLAKMDLEFHRAIWNLTGNEFLERTLVSLTAPLFAHAVLSVWREDKIRLVLNSHRPLFDYVAGASKDSAQKIIQDHVRSSWDATEALASYSRVT